MNKPMREGFVDGEPVAIEKPIATGNQMVEAPAQEPAPEPALPPDMWPMVIKLQHRPVKKTALGDTVKELTFREPTARDIMKAGGNPCRVEVVEITGTQVIYNYVNDDPKMLKLMALLTGINDGYLGDMDPRDYNSCAYRLRRFFVPEQGIW